jgi:hypothetical protein
MTDTQIIRILSNLKGAATANPQWTSKELVDSTMLACLCTEEDCYYALTHSPPMAEYEAFDFMFTSEGLMELLDKAIK